MAAARGANCHGVLHLTSSLCSSLWDHPIHQAAGGFNTRKLLAGCKSGMQSLARVKFLTSGRKPQRGNIRPWSSRRFQGQSRNNTKSGECHKAIRGGHHQQIDQLEQLMEHATVEAQFLADNNLQHTAMPQKPPPVVRPAPSATQPMPACRTCCPAAIWC